MMVFFFGAAAWVTAVAWFHPWTGTSLVWEILHVMGAAKKKKKKFNLLPKLENHRHNLTAEAIRTWQHPEHRETFE